jgi:hypothetical protein
VLADLDSLELNVKNPILVTLLVIVPPTLVAITKVLADAKLDEKELRATLINLK